MIGKKERILSHGLTDLLPIIKHTNVEACTRTCGTQPTSGVPPDSAVIREIVYFIGTPIIYANI